MVDCPHFPPGAKAFSVNLLIFTDKERLCPQAGGKESANEQLETMKSSWI